MTGGRDVRAVCHRRPSAMGSRGELTPELKRFAAVSLASWMSARGSCGGVENKYAITAEQLGTLPRRLAELDRCREWTPGSWPGSSAHGPQPGSDLFERG
jgi:hypothetical protein